MTALREVLLSPTDPPDTAQFAAVPRAFVLRIRFGHGAEGRDLVVTVDDVLNQRQRHFADLEDAFANIREALNRLGDGPGQPH